MNLSGTVEVAWNGEVDSERNYVRMENHVRMQLVSLDSDAFMNFHGQLKKRLTDFLKRLLALPQLMLRF